MTNDFYMKMGIYLLLLLIIVTSPLPKMCTIRAVGLWTVWHGENVGDTIWKAGQIFMNV